MNKIEITMRKTLQDSDISTIMDNSPDPYPSPEKINDLSPKKNTIYGRRLEILMLMLYAVDLCSFCGRVQPSHVDTKFPNNPPLYRRPDAWDRFSRQTFFFCTFTQVHTFYLLFSRSMYEVQSYGREVCEWCCDGAHTLQPRF